MIYSLLYFVQTNVGASISLVSASSCCWVLLGSVSPWLEFFRQAIDSYDHQINHESYQFRCFLRVIKELYFPVSTPWRRNRIYNRKRISWVVASAPLMHTFLTVILTKTKKTSPKPAKQPFIHDKKKINGNNEGIKGRSDVKACSDFTQLMAKRRNLPKRWACLKK
jgi:hypothetical protein